MLAQSRVEF